MTGAASARRTLAGRVRAAPPGTVRVFVRLLLISMGVPVVGAVTVSAATSVVVSSWEVATSSAPVVLEGSPVTTETAVIPTIVLIISGRIVPLSAVGTGSRSGTKGKGKRVTQTTRQKKEREKDTVMTTWGHKRTTLNIFCGICICVVFVRKYVAFLDSAISLPVHFTTNAVLARIIVGLR